MNEDTDQIVHISMTGVDGGEGRRRALGIEGEEERVDTTERRSLVLLTGWLVASSFWRRMLLHWEQFAPWTVTYSSNKRGDLVRARGAD